MEMHYVVDTTESDKYCANASPSCDEMWSACRKYCDRIGDCYKECVMFPCCVFDEVPKMVDIKLSYDKLPQKYKQLDNHALSTDEYVVDCMQTEQSCIDTMIDLFGVGDTIGYCRCSAYKSMYNGDAPLADWYEQKLNEITTLNKHKENVNV